MNDKIKNLSMLLLYLTGWEEDSRRTPGEQVFKSWKGYRFEILDALEEENLIRQLGQRNPVILTDEGLKKGESLKKEFGLAKT